MSDPFVRSMTFTIEATATTPGIRISVSEVDGTLAFTVDVMATSMMTADLRGLFFDVNNDALLSGLIADGAEITAFDTTDVINLGGGVNMLGTASAYDVGLAFGSAGIGKDDLQQVLFTLSSTLGALTLDDLAQVDFGVRLTSIGSPTDVRTDGAKLVAVSTAAPDARDDAYTIFEDGQGGLDHPAATASPLVFDVLANDTDADLHTLLINAIDTPAHGTLSIVDGSDADTLAGDALQYTPDADYAGTDQFRYAISDGNGGTDYAWVHVNMVAVADIPTMSYTVEAGNTVNEVIVRVTATDTDMDGSEFIDRLVVSGLPDGVQVTSDAINPVDQPHTLVRDFVLTLPDTQDWNFDFTVTAFAKETSNGDEQSASVTQAIIYNHEALQAPLSLTADKQSIWGALPSLLVTDAISETFSFSTGWSDPSGIFGVAVTAEAMAGIEYEALLNNGTVDANFDYGLAISSRYNQTTDQLSISSSATLAGGDFTTSAMEGALAATVFVDLMMQAGFAFDFTDYVPDLFGLIPLLSLNDSAQLPVFSTTDTAATTLLGTTGAPTPIPFDVTDIFGSHLALAWPASGSDAGAMAGDGSLTSSVDGSGFAEVYIDLDAFLTLVAGLPNMVMTINDLAPLFSATIDLLDLNMDLGMDFNQSFALEPLGLDATITFEDGQSFDFVFGQDFNISGAAAIDAAGNADGRIDYTIAVDQQASFSNLTTMDMDLSFPFEVLKIAGSYDLLGLLTGTFSVPPVYANPLALEVPSGTLFDNSFALDFVGQGIALSA